MLTHFLNTCPSVTLSKTLRVGGTAVNKARAVPAIPYPLPTDTMRLAEGVSETQLLSRCCIDQSLEIVCAEVGALQVAESLKCQKLDRLGNW